MDLDMTNLVAFDAFERVQMEDYQVDDDVSKKWTSSPWENVRKDDGTLRSPWVPQEFANTASQGTFFSPTPATTTLDLLHIHGLGKGYPIHEFGLTRAFYHAVEERHIYTSPPKGYNSSPYEVAPQAQDPRLAGRQPGIHRVDGPAAQRHGVWEVQA